jgi:hypothetical protein
MQLHTSPSINISQECIEKPAHLPYDVRCKISGLRKTQNYLPLKNLRVIWEEVSGISELRMEKSVRKSG